jgi:hypothetical protein
LSDFSGFIAAGELYDGPFCILSIVDDRTFKRLIYQVLDHNPTHRDIEAFFRRFHAALKARGLVLKGITTDGPALYPEPIAAVFGQVPHQLCTFHVLKEITKSVLSAVAKLRKDLTAGTPKLPRGRPGSKAVRFAARRKKRIERKAGELFEHRSLFVRRRLSPSERATLERISRGHPQLRALRGLMEAWRRRWYSWMRSYWERRRTRWSGGIGATGRCRRRCTGSGPVMRSRPG